LKNEVGKVAFSAKRFFKDSFLFFATLERLFKVSQSRFFMQWPEQLST